MHHLDLGLVIARALIGQNPFPDPFKQARFGQRQLTHPGVLSYNSARGRRLKVRSCKTTWLICGFSKIRSIHARSTRFSLRLE